MISTYPLPPLAAAEVAATVASATASRHSATVIWASNRWITAIAPANQAI
jgi:hypothetical protein